MSSRLGDGSLTTLTVCCGDAYFPNTSDGLYSVLPLYLTAFFLTRLRMYMSSSSQRAVAVYSLLLSVTKSTTSG